MYLIKELSVDNRKINNLVNEWSKDLDTPLTKEDIWLANKHMKILTMYVIREM